MFLALPAAFAGEVAAPEPVPTDPGYGPWSLGMSRAEVEAVEEFGPYKPVHSTGGLETFTGQFSGRTIPISFVFGGAGLRHIQVWAYSGPDSEAAFDAFHEAYLYLSDQYGALSSGGTVVDGSLGRDDLARRVPARFQPPEVAPDFAETMEELRAEGSIEADIHKLHLHPVRGPEGMKVYGSLMHSSKLNLYWVFVYFKTL